MNVNFTPAALADLQQIFSYYCEEANPTTASNVLSRIRTTTDIFTQFPLLGRQGRIENTREFSIPNLPYTIIYCITSETEIDILTILHHGLSRSRGNGVFGWPYHHTFTAVLCDSVFLFDD